MADLRHSSNPPIKPVYLVAGRFLQVFNEHGVEPAQISRLLPQVKLDDLNSPERLLTILTPDLLDQVAKFFGIRNRWLESCYDRIYDCLATDKEPHLLLDHLRRLWRPNRHLWGRYVTGERKNRPEAV